MSEQKKLETSVLCAQFIERAEPHRTEYREGIITYSELRKRLLRLQGEFQHALWESKDNNHLLSVPYRQEVKRNMVQRHLDIGHDMLPVFPSSEEERYIRGEA